jgi:pimeloyl-ACP methyl ester carboxylesterase
MKIYFYLLIILGFGSVSLSLQAQENTGAYGQSIKVKGYDGCNFRFTASVRTEIVDDSASARLWVTVFTQSDIGFNEYMWEKPIRNKDWKTYSIEGKIDSAAVDIYFGALCQYNGCFYFDDFELKIETKKDHWEKVFTDDFTRDTAGLALNKQRWEGYHNFTDLKATIYKDKRPRYENCMLVTGNGVPNYGMNNKAGKYADVNGIKLYYEIYGEGQPLLVLHGNGGAIESSSFDYPYFIKKHYKIIAIDSRAQGNSGDTDAELTYDIMASDVNELLNQLKIDSVYLWGHSDGAILGLIIALKYPDKIKKLVAFAPNIVADTTGIEPEIYHYLEKDALTNKNMKQRKLETLLLKYPNMSLSELNTIKCEVLMMAGDRDFVPLKHILDMYKNIPRSNLCIIPGATHGAAFEKQDLFLEIVTDFFEKPFAMPSTIDRFKD